MFNTFRILKISYDYTKHIFEPQSMDSSQQTALWLYIPSIKDLDQILISKRKFENFALQRIISLNSEKEMELLEIIFEE